MTLRSTPIMARALWFTLVLFTIEISAVSIARYISGGATAPDFVLANGFAHPFLVLHVIGGVVALLAGPFQLLPRIRDRFPRLHRVNGRIYAAACAIGAPAGFMLALGTKAGPVASWGFAIPAVLWPVFTYLGVRAAMSRQLSSHRMWMLRSYAITANAITLRIMLPVAGLALKIPFMTAYPVIAWLGWIVNLALVEAYIRRRPSPRAVARPLAPA